MRKYIYCDQQGIIKMVADNPIEAKSLIEYSHDFTDQEAEDIKAYSIKKYINNKVIIDKMPEESAKEVKKDLEAAKTIDDLKTIIINLIS